MALLIFLLGIVTGLALVLLLLFLWALITALKEGETFHDD